LRVLRLSGVSKRFGGRSVLKSVSLEVAPGEQVAVLGESGIGKSTLLNVIAGLEPVDGGSISFDGLEIAALSDDAATRLRREHFGFVFQAFHLLPYLTAEQNVGLPLLLRGRDAADIRTRARALLGAVGLGGREQALPRELSGGELQRVAIARALVGEPRLVLADEPTGNLDPDNARQVLEILRGQVKRHGAAGILVTHSQAAAASCDRSYRLDPEGLRPL
jgi:putative ABC transport system ATP-binding protein